MSPDGEGSEENPIVEVEFRVSDTRYPLAALSEQTGCETELMQILPRSEGYTVFKRIIGASSDQILDFSRNLDTVDARVISESDGVAIVEFRISESEDLFVVSLIDAGAIPRQLRSANGVVHIVAQIPGTHSSSDAIEHFRTIYPSMELVAQRQKEYSVPLFRQEELKRVATEALTSRQHEALVAAYAGGYYDWPREKSAEELAEEMGISPATFSQHLRGAEGRLLSLLFH